MLLDILVTWTTGRVGIIYKQHFSTNCHINIIKVITNILHNCTHRRKICCSLPEKKKLREKVCKKQSSVEIEDKTLHIILKVFNTSCQRTFQEPCGHLHPTLYEGSHSPLLIEKKCLLICKHSHMLFIYHMMQMKFPACPVFITL